jgi:hypothetical protein
VERDIASDDRVQALANVAELGEISRRLWHTLSFVIELISGRQILIGKDSEVLFSRKRPELVIAFTDDGQHEFEASAIAVLVE